MIGYRFALRAGVALALVTAAPRARAQSVAVPQAASTPAAAASVGATNVQPGDDTVTVVSNPQSERGEAVRTTTREQPRSRWGGPLSEHFYVDAQAGMEWVQLETFVADFNTYAFGMLPSSGVGTSANLGLGARLGFLTLGGRGRVSSFGGDGFEGGWQLWSLDAELGMRAPLGRFEPHFTLAGGYTQSSHFGRAIADLRGVDLHGFDGRLGAGLDYWLTRNLTLGAEGEFGVLAVTRPGVSIEDLAMAKQVSTLNQAKERVLEASGSSVGTVVGITADLGVHF